ncbi:hypothetical protein HK101_001337 [Irineochytrium annulatum]|nr:hypothetical protein HK101_001337 [Irineochytrium annulatum]
MAVDLPQRQQQDMTSALAAPRPLSPHENPKDTPGTAPVSVNTEGSAFGTSNPETDPEEQQQQQQQSPRHQHRSPKDGTRNLATSSKGLRRSSSSSSQNAALGFTLVNHHTPPANPVSPIASIVSNLSLPAIVVGSTSATHLSAAVAKEVGLRATVLSRAMTNSLASNQISLAPSQFLVTQPKGKNAPTNVEIRNSRCGGFTVVAESYTVHLRDGQGSIPMDRRCTTGVYGHSIKARGAILLIPGFASNRAVFDVGGGVGGREGTSFFEFLARRGYDTYSIDLRGSRQAMRMGSKAPAFLKEHVEVDVPSAIDLIKIVGSHEKVYLIGHSMGGAISCAVAGFMPDDVAGIVHLAGLYHFTIPYVNDVIDIYRATCPRFVQSIITATAGFAIRSAIRVLAPAASSVMNFLSPPDEQSVLRTGIEPESLQLMATKPSSIVLKVQKIVTDIRRQPIPLRTAVDLVMYIRRFIPKPIHVTLMNCMYPSPWLPYSLDDPMALVDRSAESPTIGIYLALTKMGVKETLYNAWLLQCSNHRAEVRENEEELNGLKVPDDATSRAAKTLQLKRSLTDSLPSLAQEPEGKHNLLKSFLLMDSDDTLIDIDCPPADTDDSAPADIDSPPPQSPPPSYEAPTLKQPFDFPIKDIPAVGRSEGLMRCHSQPPSAFVSMKLAAAADAATGSSANQRIPEVQVTGDEGSSSSGSSKPDNNKPSPMLESIADPWNDLAPYLERFEKLEHLPLFFCHANADAILKTEDTMAGYRRSGSRWKDVIEYVGGTPIVATTASDVAAKPPTVTGKDTAAAAAPRRKLPASMMFTPLNGSPTSPTAPSTLPTTSRSVPPSPPKMHERQFAPSLEGSGRDRLRPRYSVPDTYSYGHCDILASRHAERVWERIVDWLDDTSRREKEWRFQRRYSAK